jgi:hypothetical protein
MNGEPICVHHELILVISDKFISTVVCAFVSLINLIELKPNIS